jgi:hypothetical protein
LPASVAAVLFGVGFGERGTAYGGYSFAGNGLQRL